MRRVALITLTALAVSTAPLWPAEIVARTVPNWRDAARVLVIAPTRNCPPYIRCSELDKQMVGFLRAAQFTVVDQKVLDDALFALGGKPLEDVPVDALLREISRAAGRDVGAVLIPSADGTYNETGKSPAARNAAALDSVKDMSLTLRGRGDVLLAQVRATGGAQLMGDSGLLFNKQIRQMTEKLLEQP